MKNIETSIVINSSAEIVWEILTNFNDYSSWNPFITKLEGKAIKGNKLEVHLKLENKKAQIFKPTVLVSKEANEFRWLGRLFIKGLFDGEHYFLIERIGDEQVKFIHGENFSGILSNPIIRLIGKDTKKGFIAMNEALKKRAETPFS